MDHHINNFNMSDQTIEDVVDRAGDNITATMTLDDVDKTLQQPDFDVSGPVTVKAESSGDVGFQGQRHFFQKDGNGVWSLAQPNTPFRVYTSLPADTVSVTWRRGNYFTFSSQYDMSQLSGTVTEMSHRWSNQHSEQTSHAGGEQIQDVQVHLLAEKASKVVLDVRCAMPEERAEFLTRYLGLD